MQHIKNLSQQKKLRQQLRKNMTWCEKKIWSQLRREQMGIRFFRQYGIGRYVVDFCCPVQKIIIEIDGDVHALDEHLQSDKTRTDFLQKQGYQVIRFTNPDIKMRLNNVLEEIYRIINNPQK